MDIDKPFKTPNRETNVKSENPQALVHQIPFFFYKIDGKTYCEDEFNELVEKYGKWWIKDEKIDPKNSELNINSNPGTTEIKSSFYPDFKLARNRLKNGKKPEKSRKAN